MNDMNTKDKIVEYIFDITPSWLYRLWCNILYVLSWRFFKIWVKSYFVWLWYALIFKDRPFHRNELWDLDHVLISKILMWVKQFKAMERHWYPGWISEKKREAMLDRLIYLLWIYIDDEPIYREYYKNIKELWICETTTESCVAAMHEEIKLRKEMYKLLSKCLLFYEINHGLYNKRLLKKS